MMYNNTSFFRVFIMNKKKSIEELLISIFSLVNEAKVEYEKNLQNTIQNATKKNFSSLDTEFIDRKKINDKIISDKNIMNFNFIEKKKKNIVDEIENNLKNKFFNEFETSKLNDKNLHFDTKIQNNKIKELNSIEIQFKQILYLWMEKNIKNIVEEVFSNQIK